MSSAQIGNKLQIISASCIFDLELYWEGAEDSFKIIRGARSITLGGILLSGIMQ